LEDATAFAGGREPENEIYLCGVRNFVEWDDLAELFMSLNWIWSESAILTLADSDDQNSRVLVWRHEPADRHGGRSRADGPKPVQLSPPIVDQPHRSPMKKLPHNAGRRSAIFLAARFGPWLKT